jgi:nitroreductase
LSAPFDARAWRELASARRSKRDFLPKAVAPELIEELLTDAMTAPSWSNTRPFMVAVAKDDVRDRLSAAMVLRWQLLAEARASGVRGWFKLLRNLKALPRAEYRMIQKYPRPLLERSQRIGRDLYNLLEVPRGDRRARDAQWQRNYEFFGAPVELFVFYHAGLGIPAASDAGLFMQNLMLGATARGLGTCAQGAAAIWPDLVRAEFEIPAGYKLRCGIALGYPSDAAVNTFKAERLPAEELTARSKPRD